LPKVLPAFLLTWRGAVCTDGREAMGSKQTSSVDRLIAEKVRLFRLQAGMSQSELAAQLGVTFQQVQKYEKGLNRIGAGRLFEIARVLNLQVQAFFPLAEGADGADEQYSTEARSVGAFASSPEGQKLVRSFVQLRANQKRRITALVLELSDGQAQDKTS
jgi:transcriptional regulator with XRE-family HTH domain